MRSNRLWSASKELVKRKSWYILYRLSCSSNYWDTIGFTCFYRVWNLDLFRARLGFAISEFMVGSQALNGRIWTLTSELASNEISARLGCRVNNIDSGAEQLSVKNNRCAKWTKMEDLVYQTSEASYAGLLVDGGATVRSDKFKRKEILVYEKLLSSLVFSIL